LELLKELKRQSLKKTVPIIKNTWTESLNTIKSSQEITLIFNNLILSRPTSTLSGGESQRIKVTKHLNSALSDVLYIFDWNK